MPGSGRLGRRFRCTPLGGGAQDQNRHQWFQDDRWYDLIEVVDDATSETCAAGGRGIDTHGDGRAQGSSGEEMAVLCALQ